jgi:hypothetical protein
MWMIFKSKDGEHLGQDTLVVSKPIVNQMIFGVDLDNGKPYCNGPMTLLYENLD